ncbi:MAG: class I SAM-dependent DNA methyltransferase [Lachnospiraceae bacterium]
MEAYTDFAYVYDTMMKDIPYAEWAEYVKTLLQDDKIGKGATVAELGCGTGSFTLEMSKLGYTMTGVDISPDMLSVARSKFEDTEYDKVVFCEQDMTEFELPEKADAIVSVCDSVNYLIEDGDLDKLFVRVNENLKSNGSFIVDLKTRFFYENVLAYNTMAENFENCSYIWDNYYHEEERINEYLLTVFVKEGKLYRKFVENHFQRAYEVDDLIETARKNGFTQIKVYDAFTKEKPGKQSERVYFVFRR